MLCIYRDMRVGELVIREKAGENFNCDSSLVDTRSVNCCYCLDFFKIAHILKVFKIRKLN